MLGDDLSREHRECFERDSPRFNGCSIRRNLGDNFLDSIKAELLNTNALVLFVLTPRFYASPACLCEMGATWVLAKEHIPVLVPPFDFSDVKGVIPLTQGFKLNEPLKLNLFKDEVQAVFGLSQTLTQSAWERKRDRIV